jgi:RDD family
LTWPPGFHFFSLLIFRSTIGQRMFGFAILDRTSEPAGRARLAWRWLIGWLPFGIVAILAEQSLFSGLPPTTRQIVFLSLGSAVVLACLANAVARPARGPHDEYAGTWLVPR